MVGGEAEAARIDDLIGDAYPAERWGEAFGRAAGGEGRKVFVDL